MTVLKQVLKALHWRGRQERGGCLSGMKRQAGLLPAPQSAALCPTCACCTQAHARLHACTHAPSEPCGLNASSAVKSSSSLDCALCGGLAPCKRQCGWARSASLSSRACAVAQGAEAATQPRSTPAEHAQQAPPSSVLPCLQRHLAQDRGCAAGLAGLAQQRCGCGAERVLARGGVGGVAQHHAGVV